MRLTCTKLSNSIFKGMSLSAALAAIPESFPMSYCRIVHSGEVGGQLIDCLERLGSTLEQQERLTRLLRSALIYPGMLLASSGAMIMAVLYFVFPMLIKVTADAGVEPPALTTFLIKLSSPYMLAGIVVGFSVVFSAIFFLQRHPRFGPHLHHFWESYTPPGRFAARTQVVLSIRQLALLLDSGVDLVRGLDLAGKVGEKSLLVRVAFKDLGRLVAEGESLSEGILRHDVFPRYLSAMVAVSEEAGGTAAILYRSSDILEEELQSKIKTLSAALEPILMGLVGMVVGTVILGAFLPVYNLVAL